MTGISWSSRFTFWAVMYVFLFCSASLIACSTPVAPPQARIDFHRGPKIRLDVASVTVDNRFHSLQQAPNVEYQHELKPADIAEIWADERIAATGGRGMATLTVFDARVIEEPLPTKGGLEGLLSDEPDTQFMARIRARLSIVKPGVQPGSLSTYTADVDARASGNVLKRASMNERAAAYNSLMKAIARQFDNALSAETRRSMSPVIIP